MVETEIRDCCPECGSVSIRAKSSRPGKRDYPADYDCADCGTHFSEPDSRDARRLGPSQGLAGYLASLGEHGDRGDRGDGGAV